MGPMSIRSRRHRDSRGNAAVDTGPEAGAEEPHAGYLYLLMPVRLPG